MKIIKSDEEPDEKKSLFSESDLRIMAISLSILSLGLAIAYIGFILFLT